jgi:hypothetical protein
MCACLGVDWDLANIVQMKGESLREFIQSFCNKRNIILEVNDKSIVMFFKKGLRDKAMIRKLAMKNPRMSESMFANANKYDLAEEVTLDTREQKKEKDSGHVDQPSSSKGHNKKRGVDRSINTVEQSRRNKEYRPRPCEFECFQNCICIVHPRESTRPRTATDPMVLQMKYSRWLKGLIRLKSSNKPRATSLKLTWRSTTSMVAPILMSHGGSRNSQPGRSWRLTRHPQVP